MKRFPGKLVMAVIILSCGFVMQAEQSERANLRQADRQLDSRDAAINAPDVAKAVKVSDLRGDRSSW